MMYEDIIRMMRESGLKVHDTTQPDAIERFVALVTAAEREACAKVAENTYDRQIIWYPKGYSINPNDLGDVSKTAAEGCAAAIRARGET